MAIGSTIVWKAGTAAEVLAEWGTPDPGEAYCGIDGTLGPYWIDDTGTVAYTGMTAESVQDIAAAQFLSAGPVHFTYNDGAGTVTPSIDNATTTAAGLLTASEKIRLNSIDGRKSDLTAPRVFRPGDYMVGNTYDPTGVADSTTSYAAMVAAVVALNDRCIIELPPGVFKVATGTITGLPVGPVKIHGSGRGTTVLIPTSATGDMIVLPSGADGVALSDFAIYQTGSPNTAGDGIDTNGADSVTIENMFFVNLFNDIHVNGSSIKVSTRATLHSQTNGAAGSVGILVANGLAGDTYITDAVMSNTGATRRRASVEITESGHYELIQCNLTGSVQGMLIDPPAGKIVAFGFHTNLLCDSCVTNGMTISAPTSTSTVKNIKSVNSWYSGTITGGGAGAVTSGTAGGIINGVTFSADRFLNNQTHGFQHGFGTDFRWSDCDMKGNSAASSNASDGLNVAAGVSNWSTNGGKFGGSDTVPTATTQRYGIFVAAGAGDNIKISPDDLTGNVTGPLSMGATGANVFVTGCPGLAPQSSRKTNVTIANTETVIHSIPIPKNSLNVGSTFRIRCGGMWVNTAAGTVSILRVRIGSTTLTGNVCAGMSINCGATARAAPGMPFMFDAMVTVLSIGAGGTIFGFTGVSLSNVVAPVITAPVTAAVAVDTTADKLLELTYISGLAGNSIAVSSCTIIPEQY